MPSATTSGSDAKSNGTANQRGGGSAPQAGNQNRTWTPEQKAAVIRVKSCNPTDYYAILDLTALKPPATCSPSDVKKAYRKLSLLTHPDKNGHEHAHVAFQLVSKAYLVLSDEGKKESYDRSGRDPDSRFGGGGGGGGPPASNPFAGFGAARAGGRGGGWEEEISPEEMFNRFFGGGGGGFGGPFGGGGIFEGGGSPFVFNMGGGPGIRVHQFGGARPRRRPRPENAPPETPATFRQMIINILPLLIIFVLPLLTSLFSSTSSGPERPTMHFPPTSSLNDYNKLSPQSPQTAFKNGKSPYTHGRVTTRWNVEYYLDPLEIVDWTNRMFMDQDRKAENKYVAKLRVECQNVAEERNRLVQEAQGFFGIFVDENKLAKARSLDISSCERLNSLGLRG